MITFCKVMYINNDSAIYFNVCHFDNQWHKLQALVVKTLDSAIHWINDYPADKYWGQRFIQWRALSSF